MKAAFAMAEIDWWLFGGWGLDAQLGRITREHGDIECWVHRADAEAARDAFPIYATTRASTPADRREFFAMLAGRHRLAETPHP